jgi:hypothetical protein
MQQGVGHAQLLQIGFYNTIEAQAANPEEDGTASSAAEQAEQHPDVRPLALEALACSPDYADCAILSGGAIVAYGHQVVLSILPGFSQLMLDSLIKFQ